MTPLYQAQAILSMTPIPLDAQEQIEALEAQAKRDGLGEDSLFPDIYEALFIKTNDDLILEEK